MTTKMTQTPQLAAIGAASRELHLPTVRARPNAWPRWPNARRAGHLAYLADVLSAEIDERAEHRRQRRIREARFPRMKRLGDFDVAASPLSASTVAALASAAYLERANRWCSSVTRARARATF